jgi:hypothetical protein
VSVAGYLHSPSEATDTPALAAVHELPCSRRLMT